jgi:hypothetical protein
MSGLRGRRTAMWCDGKGTEETAARNLRKWEHFSRQSPPSPYLSATLLSPGPPWTLLYEPTEPAIMESISSKALPEHGIAFIPTLSEVDPRFLHGTGVGETPGNLAFHEECRLVATGQGREEVCLASLLIDVCFLGVRFSSLSL